MAECFMEFFSGWSDSASPSWASVAKNGSICPQWHHNTVEIEEEAKVQPRTDNGYEQTMVMDRRWLWTNDGWNISIIITHCTAPNCSTEWCVPRFATLLPGEMTRHWGKEIVEHPSYDDVIIQTDEKWNDKHRPTNTCKTWKAGDSRRLIITEYIMAGACKLASPGQLPGHPLIQREACATRLNGWSC